MGRVRLGPSDAGSGRVGSEKLDPGSRLIHTHSVNRSRSCCFHCYILSRGSVIVAADFLSI